MTTVTITEGKNVDVGIIQASSVRAIPYAEEILRECIGRSIEVWQGSIDGRSVCAWGLIPPTILSTTAWLWLIHTEHVEPHKFIFVRNSQRYIEHALTRYTEIIGEVDTGSKSSIRWLRWLGAEFGAVNGNLMNFTIRAK